MTKRNKNGNIKQRYRTPNNDGEVAVQIGGPLFIQIVTLLNSYHEVRKVERFKPEEPIDEKDYQFFIYLKNGKKFELRYGKLKSGKFEGFFFKHPKVNNGNYTPIDSEVKIKGLKEFLRLNFTQTKRQGKHILRFSAQKTVLCKTNICTKCGGSGYIRVYFKIDNGVCFKCNKDGHIPAPEGWGEMQQSRMKFKYQKFE